MKHFGKSMWKIFPGTMACPNPKIIFYLEEGPQHLDGDICNGSLIQILKWSIAAEGDDRQYEGVAVDDGDPLEAKSRSGVGHE